jgi:Na+-translocating ferredoxin:NAD+ oxidoreductase RnfE subunit
MLDRSRFLLKILLVSAVISVTIKYLAPLLAVSPTPLNALVLVLAPTIVLTLALWQRSLDS